ncbi:hypothetical protein V4C53_30135 [Paraburkholderia azotifigens]|uniref:baseplate hub protein n=1 Tax=Paraburkholderia azotifigens TaxID=2057004 RepID=UPI003177F136
MPLARRALNVSFKLPHGNVILDESLDLRVHITKQALAVDAVASIEVFNLSQTLRESLLSQFTMWNLRQVQSGNVQNRLVPSGTADLGAFIDVTIQAGYEDGSQNSTTTVFKGQVGAVTPISDPPNIGVRIDCRSQLLARTQFVTSPAPTQTTFKNYVAWVAEQMGLPFDCETSYDNQIITNPSAQTMVVAALLIDIQNQYRPNVAAFIDNNTLIVKDVNKIISTSNTVTVSEFIGTPMWSEWGIELSTLFDPRIRLAGAIIPNSTMNPGIGTHKNQRAYVITQLDYDLCSRATPFYVKVNASPSA